MTPGSTDHSPLLRSMLLVTTGATFVLILLGVYTAAVGAGLACGGRWPLCDGPIFGLIPASWPSFVEWVHRFVAMLTGFTILATGAVAWRQGSVRVRRAMILAVVLLPLQIIAGGQTVLTYEPFVLTSHFVIALTIFSAIVFAAAVEIAPTWHADRAVRRTLGISAVGLPVFTVIGPGLVLIHSGAVQVLYVAVGLLVLASLIGTLTLASRLSTVPPGVARFVAYVVTGSAVAVAGKLVLGRLPTTAVRLSADLGLAAVAWVAALAALYMVVARSAGPTIDAPETE